MDQNDHDLIIEMRQDIKALRADISDLKDNTKAILSDHEKRIRFLERYTWMALGVVYIVDAIIGFYLLYHHG